MLKFEKLNDDIHYDKQEDVYDICGTLFAGSALRNLAKTLPVGKTFKLVNREPDGALAIGLVD